MLGCDGFEFSTEKHLRDVWACWSVFAQMSRYVGLGIYCVCKGGELSSDAAELSFLSCDCLAVLFPGSLKWLECQRVCCSSSR